MASLVRRKNGAYHLDYYVGDKRLRQSLGTTNRKVAEAKKLKFELDRTQGIDNPLPSKTPLPEILDAYVAHLRANKPPKSAQNMVYYLRTIFGPICDGLRITSRRVGPASRLRPATTPASGSRKEPVIEVSCLETLTTSVIATFIDERVQRCDLAAKTANQTRQIIGTLINWAMTQRGVRMPGDVNPAKRVQRCQEPTPVIRFLRLPQVAQQLEVLKDHPVLQAMVAMFIYAGLRREEAMWLTVHDVDLTRNLIHVRAKTVNGIYWQPKTKGSVRVVPIGTDLRGYLEKYQPAASESQWYFPSPAGKWWDPDNFSSDLREINRAAGLAWACLDFRHTFGSQLAIAGRSLHQIAKLMGNSPEICRRHYAALLPEEMHDVVEFPKAAPPS